VADQVTVAAEEHDDPLDPRGWPGGAPKDVTVTLRLPAALHDALRERAAAEDLTISQLLRRAAMIYLATPCLVPPLGGNQ
jgi:hypothetical protein